MLRKWCHNWMSTILSVHMLAMLFCYTVRAMYGISIYIQCDIFKLLLLLRAVLFGKQVISQNIFRLSSSVPIAKIVSNGKFFIEYVLPACTWCNLTQLLQAYTDLVVSNVVDAILWVNGQRVVSHFHQWFHLIFVGVGTLDKVQILKFSHILPDKLLSFSYMDLYFSTL